MKLDIRERLVVSGLLPPEGNFITLKIIQKLREALAPTEKETKDWEIQVDVNQYKWDGTKDTTVDIAISEAGREMIVDALKKLDDSKTLTGTHFSVYEKFVNEV